MKKIKLNIEIIKQNVRKIKQETQKSKNISGNIKIN